MSVEDKAGVPSRLASIKGVPRTVVALGVVSLFIDLSSEIIHSLLPVFLVTVLGAGVMAVGIVLVARFIDRIGKGIRGAPRDALIGDVTPVELRGTAFGLRQ